MFINAYKDGDKYILPIKGTKEKIKVEIDEEEAGIDWLHYIKTTESDSSTTEMTKEEYQDQRGKDLWRKYLLLDEATMKEHWMELAMTHENPNISDDDLIEQAHADWDKED